MRALAASYISAISVENLGVFHTPELPHHARHTQGEFVSNSHILPLCLALSANVLISYQVKAELKLCLSRS
jgi:hypothetical protein